MDLGRIFLAGGPEEGSETSLECGRRELREEAGITAESWRPPGSYPITLIFSGRPNDTISPRLKSEAAFWRYWSGAEGLPW